MPKSILRAVTLLLVGCLVADPTIAIPFAVNVPTVSPQKTYMARALFEQEAFVVRLVVSPLQSLSRHLRSGYIRLAETLIPPVPEPPEVISLCNDMWRFWIAAETTAEITQHLLKTGHQLLGPVAFYQPGAPQARWIEWVEKAIAQYDQHPNSHGLAYLGLTNVRFVPSLGVYPQGTHWHKLVYVDSGQIIIHEEFLVWLKRHTRTHEEFIIYLSEVLGHENVERSYSSRWHSFHRRAQQLFERSRIIEEAFLRQNDGLLPPLMPETPRRNESDSVQNLVELQEAHRHTARLAIESGETARAMDILESVLRALNLAQEGLSKDSSVNQKLTERIQTGKLEVLSLLQGLKVSPRDIRPARDGAVLAALFCATERSPMEIWAKIKADGSELAESRLQQLYDRIQTWEEWGPESFASFLEGLEREAPESDLIKFVHKLTPIPADANPSVIQGFPFLPANEEDRVLQSVRDSLQERRANRLDQFVKSKLQIYQTGRLEDSHRYAAAAAETIDRLAFSRPRFGPLLQPLPFREAVWLLIVSRMEAGSLPPEQAVPSTAGWVLHPENQELELEVLEARQKLEAIKNPADLASWTAFHIAEQIDPTVISMIIFICEAIKQTLIQLNDRPLSNEELETAVQGAEHQIAARRNDAIALQRRSQFSIYRPELKIMAYLTLGLLQAPLLGWVLRMLDHLGPVLSGAQYSFIASPVGSMRSVLINSLIVAAVVGLKVVYPKVSRKRADRLEPLIRQAITDHPEWDLEEIAQAIRVQGISADRYAVGWVIRDRGIPYQKKGISVAQREAVHHPVTVLTLEQALTRLDLRMQRNSTMRPVDLKVYAKPLWTAVRDHQIYADYPLDYHKYDAWLAALFGYKLADPLIALDLRETIAQAIKRRYRQLIRRFHPDRNPGDPIAAQKTNFVMKAYDLLCSNVTWLHHENLHDEPLSVRRLSIGKVRLLLEEQTPPKKGNSELSMPRSVLSNAKGVSFEMRPQFRKLGGQLESAAREGGNPRRAMVRSLLWKLFSARAAPEQVEVVTSLLHTQMSDAMIRAQLRRLLPDIFSPIAKKGSQGIGVVELILALGILGCTGFAGGPIALTALLTILLGTAVFSRGRGHSNAALPVGIDRNIFWPLLTDVEKPGGLKKMRRVQSELGTLIDRFMPQYQGRIQAAYLRGSFPFKNASDLDLLVVVDHTDQAPVEALESDLTKVNAKGQILVRQWRYTVAGELEGPLTVIRNPALQIPVDTIDLHIVGRESLVARSAGPESIPQKRLLRTLTYFNGILIQGEDCLRRPPPADILITAQELASDIPDLLKGSHLATAIRLVGEAGMSLGIPPTAVKNYLQGDALYSTRKRSRIFPILQAIQSLKIPEATNTHASIPPTSPKRGWKTSLVTILFAVLMEAGVFAAKPGFEVLDRIRVDYIDITVLAILFGYIFVRLWRQTTRASGVDESRRPIRFWDHHWPFAVCFALFSPIFLHLTTWAVAHLIEATVRVRIGNALDRGAGSLLAGVGVWIFLKADRQLKPQNGAGMESTGPLLTSGLYQWIRNPIYFGYFLILGGLYLFMVPANVAPLYVLYPPFIYVFIRIAQEESKILLDQFGDVYKAYVRKTPLFPFWPARFDPVTAESPNRNETVVTKPTVSSETYIRLGIILCAMTLFGAWSEGPSSWALATLVGIWAGVSSVLIWGGFLRGKKVSSTLAAA